MCLLYVKNCKFWTSTVKFYFVLSCFKDWLWVCLAQKPEVMPMSVTLHFLFRVSFTLRQVVSTNLKCESQQFSYPAVALNPQKEDSVFWSLNGGMYLTFGPAICPRGEWFMGHLEPHVELWSKCSSPTCGEGQLPKGKWNSITRIRENRCGAGNGPTTGVITQDHNAQASSNITWEDEFSCVYYAY